MNLAKLLGEIEFPAANREKWRALAEKTLAGASFEDALVSRSDDAIRIEPIYERVANAPLEHRKNPQAPWLVVQRIDDPDPDAGPTGRRSTISRKARPACRSSSKARRTPSDTDCRHRRKHSKPFLPAYRLREPICASTPIPRAAPWPTGSSPT